VRGGGAVPVTPRLAGAILAQLGCAAGPGEDKGVLWNPALSWVSFRSPEVQ